MPKSFDLGFDILSEPSLHVLVLWTGYAMDCDYIIRAIYASHVLVLWAMVTSHMYGHYGLSMPRIC